MRKEINHRPYILIGSLIWIASFLGEAFKFQPYSTIGIIISPIITFWGVYHWFIFYKNTKGHYPKFIKTSTEKSRKMRDNPFYGIKFMFTHTQETWAFTIVIWMILTITIFLSFGQSNAFKAAKNYCQNNTEIIEKTGKIEYYGILIGGSLSTKGETGSSDFTFTIVAENGNFNANAKLIKSNYVWKVTELKVE